MTFNEITKYLEELNYRLQLNKTRAELYLYGGAVMCLSLRAREATHDIDALFVPKADVQKLIRDIALEFELS